MRFFKQILGEVILILTKPSKFFESVKGEKGVKKSFVYLASLTLVNLVLGIVATFVLTGQTVLPLGIPGLIIDFLISLAISFVLAGLLHIWVRIFGGKEKYAKTYQLYVYSSTPKFIIGWIPYYIVSLVVGIYSLILMIIGGQSFYGFSRKKSILVFVGYIILSIVLVFLVGFAIAALFVSMGISPLSK